MITTPHAPVVRLFDLDILAVDFAQATEMLVQAAQQREGRAKIVVTPNTDHIVRLERATPAFRHAYAQADFIFADGMPVVWASRRLGRALPARVTGADLFVSLCRRAAAEHLRALVIGGFPGSETMLTERFEQVYPGLDVEVICPSMSFDPVGQEGQDAADHARRRQADIIFVCVGLPKQENWAFQHAASLDGGIILCVGAAMDFALGFKARAPMWMQRSGTEWLWRLGSDPKRLWRRYLVEDTKFAKLVWREWRRIKHER